MIRQPLSLVHELRPPAPRALAAGMRPPLLVLMHGIGGNERHGAALAPAFDPRFVVVSVRSPIALGPNAFAWFNLRFTPQGPVIVAAEAEAGWHAVVAFAREATAAYGADPARVFVGGFSQGGIMALAALLVSPKTFAGAVCMSGRLLPEVLPHVDRHLVAAKPVLVVHGEHDRTLGIHMARTAKAQLADLRVALTYRELPIGHEITPPELADVSAWLTAQLGALLP